MNENTYSIILRDHESDTLFIAEVVTQWDIERIEKENRKLNEEFWEDNYEWDPDFYVELWIRTWLNIYRADVLYV